MNEIKKFTRWITCLILFTASACSNLTPKPLPTEQGTTLTPDSTIQRISSQLAASSIQELAHYSDIIAIGQVVSKEQIINTARDPDQPTQPDPHFFSINQVYEVKVESILKGEAQKTLLVAQNQGLLAITSDLKPDSTAIENEIKGNEGVTFIPLSTDTRYLFFLRILDKTGYAIDGHKSTDLYAGVAEPWRFIVNPDGSLSPETLLSGLNSCLSQQTLASIEAILTDLDQNAFIPGYNYCNNPYPLPSTDSSEQPSESIPYP